MTPENASQLKPYEVFGITKDEVTRWRVSDEKLKEILADKNTTIHRPKISSNSFGEFLFLTLSRGSGPTRTAMTFYGLGMHEYRDRWIHDEWFWYQSISKEVKPDQTISLEDVRGVLKDRLNEIAPHFTSHTQSELGKMFEEMADLTDDDGALAEMQDMGLL